jgi:hypothetical protein
MTEKSMSYWLKIYEKKTPSLLRKEQAQIRREAGVPLPRRAKNQYAACVFAELSMMLGAEPVGKENEW